jgi:WD40 repeat protein
VSREVRKEDDLRFLCLGAKRYRRLTVLSQRRILSTSSEILHLDGGMPTDRTRVENSLTLWAIPEGRRLADIARVLDKDDSPAAILSEGGFVTFHEDGPMRVWDPETGLCTAVLEGHGEAAGSALELPGKRILTWSRDGAIRTWDLGSGACGMVLDGHQGEVQGARLIGERRLVSWSKDRTLRVWDLKSGRATAVLESFTADVQGAHGFDDGTVIAWEGNGMYRSWNAETSRGLESLDENECVRLHPDWILARLQSEDRGLSAQSGFVSWKPGMRPGSSALGVLFVGGGSGFEALWHGESWVRRKSVSPDGTLIACTEEGHVFFPKLFWGARRVSLGEAQDIALRRRGGLPSPPGPR